MPETGVLPPLLMLAVVRAIAPVAGMPPKRIEPTLATPWAISSQSDLWRLPVMPSATTAESSDSIAASRAIVRAEGINSRTSLRLKGGKWGVGSEPGMPPNLLPMVATDCKLNSQTTSEAATTATIMPGTRGTVLRSSKISATLPMPTQAVAGVKLVAWEK